MRYVLFLIILTLLSCNQNSNRSSGIRYKEKGSWIKLFNGHDLTNWTCKFNGLPAGENYKNTFRVEDGLLKVAFDEYDKFNNKFGHLFYKDKFSNYKIRVEYRFTGKQTPGAPAWAILNNGIMIHSQSPESMELNQPFPVSIEVQLVAGNGKDKRPTAGVCTPGTVIKINGKTVKQHCTPSLARTYKPDEWVTVEVVVLSNKLIQHFVDGKKVLEYTDPVIGGTGKPQDYAVPDGTPLKEGFIAIQAEGQPTEFRKIELIKLEEN